MKNSCMLQNSDVSPLCSSFSAPTSSHSEFSFSYPLHSSDDSSSTSPDDTEEMSSLSSSTDQSSSISNILVWSDQNSDESGRISVSSSQCCLSDSSDKLLSSESYRNSISPFGRSDGELSDESKSNQSDRKHSFSESERNSFISSPDKSISNERNCRRYHDELVLRPSD